MDTANYWLYIEPFVYITIKRDNEALLYNTYNGKSLNYTGIPILKIIKKIKSKKNSYVVKLNNESSLNIEVMDFIKDIRKYFMGDIIKITNKLRRPFQLMPTPEFVTRNEDQKDTEEYLMKNLFKLFFYINGKCSHDCDVCQNAYKQIPFCKKDARNDELKIELIKNIVKEAENSAASELNILGGSILKYSAIDELIQVLNQSGRLINYYLNYRNIDVAQDESTFSLMRTDKTIIKILLNSQVNEPAFLSVINFFNKFNLNTEYEFLIEDKEQYDYIDDLTDRIDLDNYSFRTFFNNDNIDFFKKYVFLTKYDIVSAKPSLDDIFCRMNINRLFFGNLSILTNGDVYSNLNRKKIGNIYINSLIDVVAKEMISGHNWKAIRSKVEPCKYCVYENLCPPISNYEYILGRYNLCNVKNGTKKNAREK